ncbi:MAG: transcription antitermination factor NusB [Nitriliruptorales bacterium]|nr:transcription antitermination factor NusB [Nitriliruptorales bacterium]
MADPATPRRTDTNEPVRARHRALLILFQADLRGVPAAAIVGELADDPDAVRLLDEHDDDCPPGPGTLDGFTTKLVEGVAATVEDLDRVIEQFAREWTVDRMPVVDRCILRMATWELKHESTPPAVVIDEAIRAARALSTDDSPRWVNGVLESIRSHLSPQSPTPETG